MVFQLVHFEDWINEDHWFICCHGWQQNTPLKVAFVKILIFIFMHDRCKTDKKCSNLKKLMMLLFQNLLKKSCVSHVTKQ